MSARMGGNEGGIEFGGSNVRVGGGATGIDGLPEIALTHSCSGKSNALRNLYESPIRCGDAPLRVLPFRMCARRPSLPGPGTARRADAASDLHRKDNGRHQLR